MLPGWVTATVAVLLCAAYAAPAPALAATSTPAAWTAISTPIPRAALLAALDLDPALPRTLTLLEAVRRLHEDDTRRGTLRARLAAMLLSPGTPGGSPGREPSAHAIVPAHEDAAIGAASNDNLVPLPLTEKFWESCITGPRT
jgi:hypothetical protein